MIRRRRVCTRRGCWVEELGCHPAAYLRDETRALRGFVTQPPRAWHRSRHNREGQGHTRNSYCPPAQSRLRIAYKPPGFKAACLKILFKVPRDKSSLGLPATVTRPGLDGCLNCRWLPRVATKIQPSSCRILMTFLIFINSLSTRKNLALQIPAESVN